MRANPTRLVVLSGVVLLLLLMARLACSVPRLEFSPTPTPAPSPTPTPTPGPVYQNVLGILGRTGVVLPLVDPEQPSSFTTVGAISAVFTWSEPPPPTALENGVPVVTFNGTDEEADSPDAAYWTRGDGSNDSPMSVGLWVNLADLASSSLLSKYSDGGSQEYITHLSRGKLQFLARDRSAAVEVNRLADAALSADIWHFVVVTYDGTGGATAMNGATWYVDGAAVASTATNNGRYVSMEDTSQVVELGDRNNGSFFKGKMGGGPLGPFFTHKELSADDVSALYEMGREALGL